MKDDINKELLRHTDELRFILSQSSTLTIVGMCTSYFLTFPERKGKNDILFSPAKELFFMLGLMGTTPEPSIARDFGSEDWKTSTELLNRIFSAYASMFWPTKEELPNLTDEWQQTRMVVMPAFLHYFNTSIMASGEQLRDRVKRYIIPFDKELKGLTGISATDALRITTWIADSLQSHIDSLQDEFVREKTLRLGLLERADKEAWSLDQLRRETQSEPYMASFQNVIEGIDSFMTVKRSSLVEEFGATLSDIYWPSFVLSRGEHSEFRYLTEKNPAEERPLFALEDERAMCPSVNMLFYALLGWGESTLEGSGFRDSYLRRRDEQFEKEVSDELRSFIPKGLETFENVYETPKTEFEHDLIIRVGRNLAIIEAKATPPVEPFRDPEKAFLRIQRTFKSDRGIQKAFDQANQIRRRLISGNQVDLFSKEGELVVSLNPTDFDFVLCMCLTRDDYGPIAVDLSLLLKKEPEENYPWAINILDMHTLLGAWRHLDCTPNKFFEYARGRIRLHGKLLCFDELEIAGFDIQHGGLTFLVNNKADRVHLNPGYSDIFDDIYRANQLGTKVTVTTSQPFATDVRKLLKGIAGEDDNVRKKIGRKKLCPCGSGTKYKYCHGK